MTSEQDRNQPVSLSGALADFLETSGLKNSLARLGALDEWADAVGPRIAAVTKAVEVRGEVLVVEVQSSAWMNELSMMGEMVLDRVNASRAGPPFARIRYRLAGAPDAADAAPCRRIERRQLRAPARSNGCDE